MIVDCAVYENGLRRAGVLPLEDAFDASRCEGAFVWIGLHEPTEEEFDRSRTGSTCIRSRSRTRSRRIERPKVEIYGESLLVVLKTARYLEVEEAVEFGEIQVFIGEDFVVTVRHGDDGTA